LSQQSIEVSTKFVLENAEGVFDDAPENCDFFSVTLIFFFEKTDGKKKTSPRKKT